MPELNVNREPECKPGDHVLTLTNVDLVIGKNKFAKLRDENGKETDQPDPDAVREQLVWRFESDEKNDFDEPYVQKVWTNTTYGNSRASLTKFLDMIVPDIDIDAVRHMNTDNFVGLRYKAKLRKVKGEGGKEFINITDIEPILDKKGKQERVIVAAKQLTPPPAAPNEVPV